MTEKEIAELCSLMSLYIQFKFTVAGRLLPCKVTWSFVSEQYIPKFSCALTMKDKLITNITNTASY